MRFGVEIGSWPTYCLHFDLSASLLVFLENFLLVFHGAPWLGQNHLVDSTHQNDSDLVVQAALSWLSLGKPIPDLDAKSL